MCKLSMSGGSKTRGLQSRIVVLFHEVVSVSVQCITYLRRSSAQPSYLSTSLSESVYFIYGLGLKKVTQILLIIICKNK